MREDAQRADPPGHRNRNDCRHRGGPSRSTPWFIRSDDDRLADDSSLRLLVKLGGSAAP
jgi:hypothetical protein